MTYTSARWANEDHIGVLLLKSNAPSLFVDSGPLYDAAISGEFGKIADPLVIVTYPTSDDIRVQRNALLAESDWTQVADAPVNKTAWAAYRQELRDITEQAGFPTEVIWPTKPS